LRLAIPDKDSRMELYVRGSMRRIADLPWQDESRLQACSALESRGTWLDEVGL
jgi:hypothetical protein